MNIKTAKLLLSEGFDNVFVVDPPSDRSFILISKSGGYGQDTGDTTLTYPTIQIMVANKDYQTAGATTQEIKKYLMGLSYKDIDRILASLVNPNWDNAGIWEDFGEWDKFKEYGELVGYQLQSDVIELGRDEQLRYRMSINFKLYQNN